MATSTGTDWTKEKPRDLPAKFGWTGHENTDLTDFEGNKAEGWLVSEVTKKGERFIFVDQDESGQWDYVTNLERSDYKQARQAQKKFEDRLFTKGPLAKGFKTARKLALKEAQAHTAVSRLRAAAKTGVSISETFGVGSPPGTPKGGIAKTFFGGSTPPGAAAKTRRRRSASPVRRRRSPARGTTPRGLKASPGPRPRTKSPGVWSFRGAKEKKAEKKVTKQTKAERRAERAKIDAQLRHVQLFRYRHGDPVHVPTPAPPGLGAPSYGRTQKLPAPGYGFQARSSRIWRENQNERARSRWRRMMGWGISENIRIF